MFAPIDAYVLAYRSGPKKFCRKCQTPKPLGNFRKHRLHRDRLNSHCTPCAQAAEAKHFKDHPDKLSRKRENTRQYQKDHPRDRSLYHKQRRAAFTPEQRDHEREVQRKCREAKPEQYKKMFERWEKNHPGNARVRAKKWLKKHPWKTFEYNFIRRARLKNAPVIERINRKEIIERDNAICHICKKKVKLHEMSLDHLIPLSQGGPHTASNLAVAHRVCNGRRGAGRIPAQLRLY